MALIMVMTIWHLLSKCPRTPCTWSNRVAAMVMYFNISVSISGDLMLCHMLCALLHPAIGMEYS